MTVTMGIVILLSSAPLFMGRSTEELARASGGGSNNDAIGHEAYAMCAACHGQDGKGLKVGQSLMAPSLVGSELLLGDPEKALLVVLKGIAKEDGAYMGQMAPLGAALDDERLAAVINYTRNTWGNHATEVTQQQAATARAKFQSVDAPAGVKRSEIDKIVGGG